MEKIQIKSLIFIYIFVVFLYGCNQSIKTPIYKSPEVDTDETPSPSKDTGYTLNVKKKEEFNENEFEDLFKD